MRVGIVGCGLIGRRRAEVISGAAEDDLIIVADVDQARAAELAAAAGSLSTTAWRQVVERPELDTVIVATTHDWLAPVTIAALEAGKHVLCEKPPGRDAEESRKMVEAADAAGRKLKTGFNHRHHPALTKARELAGQGAIGDVLFVRCRYGHGGRPGYAAEWRADPEVSGGGELLDQGIHAIDLFRWFLGDFAEAFGYTDSYVWGQDRAGGSVEDNVFALFRTDSRQVASLHASWTQWKNLFSFEVYGRDGYLNIEGLGGSYGPERLAWGRRKPESGPPDEESFDFPASDVSWEAEWLEFTSAIREDREPLGSGRDGWQALRMVDAVYESTRTGAVVRIERW